MADKKIAKKPGAKKPAQKKPKPKKPVSNKKGSSFLKVVLSVVGIIILTVLLFAGLYALFTNITFTPFWACCITFSAGLIEMFIIGIIIKLM